MREEFTGGGTAVVADAGIDVGGGEVNVGVGGAVSVNVDVATAGGAGVNEGTTVSTGPEG